MPTPSLDDRALEALLNGTPTAQSGLDWLVPFVEDLDGASQAPAPVVNPALARLLAEGFSPELGEVLAAGPPPARRRRRLTLKAAGLGFALMASGTTAAAAAGVLPEPAQHAVAAVVEATTPFSLPDTADGKAKVVPTVSKDATGAPDGVAGVDGRTVSSAVRNSTSTTAAGATGLNRANQTPAAGHAPTTVPANVNAGRPETPGSKGLGTAATTPAAGKAPSTVPADTRPSPPTTGPRGQGATKAHSTPTDTRLPARP